MSPQKDSASPLSQLGFLKNLNNDKKQTKGKKEVAVSLPRMLISPQMDNLPNGEVPNQTANLL